MPVFISINSLTGFDKVAVIESVSFIITTGNRCPEIGTGWFALEVSVVRSPRT